MPFDGAKALKYSGVKGGTGCDAATAQYRWVKFSADNTVVPCAATTDVPCGILQAPVPAVGDPADVVVIGSSFLQADASMTYGNQVSTSADGQGQTAVAGQYVVGIVQNVAGATTAGNLVTVACNAAAPVLL